MYIGSTILKTSIPSNAKKGAYDIYPKIYAQMRENVFRVNDIRTNVLQSNVSAVIRLPGKYLSGLAGKCHKTGK
jgi:hypothetical protein